MSVITRTLPKADPADRVPRGSIEFVAWPLRDQPGVAGLTIGLLVVVGILAIWVTGSWLSALLAVFLTTLSTWRVFVPQTFEFSPSGISQQVWRRKRRIAWTAIGRCDVRSGGVFLLPVGADAPIDSLNGLFIPLGSRRDDVLLLVQQQMARHAAPAGADSARVAGANKERPA